VDEFLIRAAIILGVSQSVIENEFYMVDIPHMLEEKMKEKHKELFEKVIIQLATNSRSLEDEEFKKFIEKITKILEVQEKNNQFDREKFEHLRLLTNMGANRFR